MFTGLGPFFWTQGEVAHYWRKKKGAESHLTFRARTKEEYLGPKPPFNDTVTKDQKTCHSSHFLKLLPPPNSQGGEQAVISSASWYSRSQMGAVSKSRLA